MTMNSKARWVGPFQMRNLLDAVSYPKPILPPQEPAPIWSRSTTGAATRRGARPL